jgi:hypothetical protein
VTIAVGPLSDDVSATLLDRTRRTWTLLELVAYLNEALTATAAVKPDMYPKKEFVALVAGTSQTVPSDGVALFDVVQNEVSGKTVTQVDAELLTEANRFWPAATRELDVEHFAFDPRSMMRFDVTPPNNGSGRVEILYGAIPTAVTGSSGEELDVNASFEAPLKNYVFGKAYQKNSKKQDLAKSTGFMNAWGALLGLKSKGQLAVAPKVAVSEGKA